VGDILDRRTVQPEEAGNRKHERVQLDLECEEWEDLMTLGDRCTSGVSLCRPD